MSIGTVWLPGTWGTDTWQTGDWADVGAPAATVPEPPQPTILLFEDVTTTLAFIGDDGFTMPIPLNFPAGATGPITVSCKGSDGTPEDLSTAALVTLRVVNRNGTVAVNGVVLTNPSSDGTATWTRLSQQVSTPGDYRSQVTVVRQNGTTGYYPTAESGAPITISATI